MNTPRYLATRIALRFLTDRDSAAAHPDVERLVREISVMLDNAPAGSAPAGDDDRLFACVMKMIVERGIAPFDPWIEERSGTAVRPIWDDRSFLIRCAAGTPFPAHVHDREERVVILDGDLRFGAERFSAGTCIVSDRGSTHEAGEAEADCLFLVQYGD